jgi:hypothetical protein
VVLLHIFATWRDRRNAQRARRIEHLVSAYQRLIEASQRDSLTPDQAKNVEDAVSDVLLLGQRAEVEAASAFIENWALRGSTDMKPLLTALRASLRAELHLDSTLMPELFNLRITTALAEKARAAKGSPRAKPPNGS